MTVMSDSQCQHKNGCNIDYIDAPTCESITTKRPVEFTLLAALGKTLTESRIRIRLIAIQVLGFRVDY